ncbi:RIP metalloprotease RseP [Dokdonia sinensis]|uniref:Zinc metalloprotease n=1 Tax=Dokdonia sinensis TaxID=2479847 RepID=A0A3M0FWV5_9FLAO|nr:RIP metalloprotease RseP [Dokdonia sinensis]RMB56457.1 RIP metalloprotease RseP [Dokdonia sinensis]
MDVLIQTAQLILALSILVILHEFGHFIPARLFKIKVEKFFLFFDVKFALFKKKIGDTVYGVGWLPLGGYVKIAGMIDESMDKEQMAKPPEPWEFRSKPAWQRLIVMIGGVTVNVLLAWFLYSAMLVYYGDTYIPANNLENGIAVSKGGEAMGFQNGDQLLAVDGKEVSKFDKYLPMEVLLADTATVERNGEEVTFTVQDSGKKIVLEDQEPFIMAQVGTVLDRVEPNSLAEKGGLQAGDKILTVNGEEMGNWLEVLEQIGDSKGSEMVVVYERNGDTNTQSFTVPEDKPLGVYGQEIRVTDEYGVLESIPAGWNQTVGVLKGQIRQFKLIFNKEVQGYKQVKGPIGIVSMMDPTWNWFKFWGFVAMFSVWLAFVNILPIPALDGGHVMFLLYEMISGRKPSEKTLERGQIVGFVIVMGLMVVIFGNDIWNLIKGNF